MCLSPDGKYIPVIYHCENKLSCHVLGILKREKMYLKLRALILYSFTVVIVREELYQLDR